MCKSKCQVLLYPLHSVHLLPPVNILQTVFHVAFVLYHILSLPLQYEQTSIFQATTTSHKVHVHGRV